MKIALFSDNFPSKGNPTYIFVQQLVFALVDQGVEVSVIAPQSLTHIMFRGGKLLPKCSYEKTANGNPFKVYRPYDITFGNKLSYLTNFTNVVFNSQLISILNSIKPDVLYGHFWHTAYKMKDYALKHNLPLFVACGEGDNALEQLVETISVKNKKELVEAVKGVISVSSENKRKCIVYGLAKEKDIVVLPNCVDDTLFYPADGTELRKKLGVGDRDFFILFIGGFITRKGPDRLSQAIDRISDSSIKVAFIGKPMAGDSVIPSCNGIVFLGPLEHDLLPEYFNAADVFVLPTQKEGCSNAIVESLACGTPVISANRPFNADILNENNSIMVDPDSVDEIIEAISKLRYNVDLLNKKKEYAEKHSHNYSIKGRAKKICDFIDKKVKEYDKE